MESETSLISIEIKSKNQKIEYIQKFEFKKSNMFKNLNSKN